MYLKQLLISLFLLLCLSETQAQFTKTHSPFDGLKNKATYKIGGFMRFTNYHNYVHWDEERYTDYVLHNNLYYLQQYDDQNLLFVSMHNRLFFGEGTSLNASAYAQSLSQNNDWLNTDFIVFENDEQFLISNFDRFFYQWRSKKVNVRVGKQAYYWNQSFVWNPNNYLNTYSIFGYDVQNRNSILSIKSTFRLGDKRSPWTLDLAYAPHETFDKSIVTGRFLYKKKRNEFQIVGASVLDDVSVGFGFTTYINETGFSGEISYFQPKDITAGESALLIDLSTYYTFPNKLFLLGEVLYHSNPQTSFVQNDLFANSGVKNLITNNIQLAGLAQMPIGKRVYLGSSAVYYVDDEDLSFNAFVQYKISKQLQFYLSYNLYGQQELVTSGDSRKFLLADLTLKF
ncbi:MAG: hypothetical protein ACPG4W_01065 [Flavobacteriales bacterium]